MNAEEAKQFLANLAPGEAELILRDNMISPGERHQFQKRQAQLLYESLYRAASRQARLAMRSRERLEALSLANGVSR